MNYRNNISRKASVIAGKPVDLSIIQEFSPNLHKQKELIEIFYQKSLQDIESLKQSFSTKDQEKWRRSSHSLKGSAGYIGAEKLFDLCNVAQYMLDSSVKERKQQYNKIISEHQNICAYLYDHGFLKEVHKN